MLTQSTRLTTFIFLPLRLKLQLIQPCLVLLLTPLLYSKLIKLNVRSAGGSDHVPPIILNKCSINLSYPISFLFQLYFDNSFLPALWLQAYVRPTPVSKKGDSSAVGNYRPISLTYSLCKLMECMFSQGSVTVSTLV